MAELNLYTGESMAKAVKKKVNCQLPGAELLEQGKSVDEIMQTLDQKKRGPGRPRIFDTPEQMQAAIDDYFESCWGIIEITKGEGESKTTETRRVQERPYTIMGLALALNMCRETLCDYAKQGQFSDIVKRAKQTVELAVEEQLIAGKNATGPIFWLKNHAGYKDKQELEHSGPNGGPVEFNDIQRSARIAAILAEARKRANK